MTAACTHLRKLWKEAEKLCTEIIGKKNLWVACFIWERSGNEMFKGHASRAPRVYLHLCTLLIIPYAVPPELHGLEESCARTAESFSPVDGTNWMRQLNAAYWYDLNEKQAALSSLSCTPSCMAQVCQVWEREPEGITGKCIYLCSQCVDAHASVIESKIDGSMSVCCIIIIIYTYSCYTEVLDCLNYSVESQKIT